MLFQNVFLKLLEDVGGFLKVFSNPITAIALDELYCHLCNL